MADPINLNKARKTRAREDAKRQAAENRVRFGREVRQGEDDDAIKRYDDLKRAIAAYKTLAY